MDMHKRISLQICQEYRIGTTIIIFFACLLRTEQPLNTAAVIYMQMLFIRTCDIGQLKSALCYMRQCWRESALSCNLMITVQTDAVIAFSFVA